MSAKQILWTNCRYYLRPGLLLFVLLFLSQQSFSQVPQDRYQRREAMIPMRDGIRLYTIIFTPKNSAEALPFLVCRTPYGVQQTPSPERIQPVSEMASESYIFVYQDIRGRFGSEGQFQMMRSPRNEKDKNAIDEGTDAYDTFEWLLKNVPNHNGRIGIYGGSYDAWTAIMAALAPHPALKAISEQASPADMFLGDDFHHNGAFRLSYGFEYAYMQEASKEISAFPFPVYDTYEWYLKLGPLSKVNKAYFHHNIPTWDNFVAHPNYDSFWQQQALPLLLDIPKVPVLNVAGWWDQEDFYGPLTAYATWEKKDRSHNNYLVIGPWNHGGWAYGTGKKLGNLDFESLTTIKFRKDILAAWFAYFLKGKGEGKFPEAIIFQTGSNTWKTYETWPPEGAVKRNLYFAAGGKLLFNKPTETETTFDRYVSDPANPVPYRTRPIEATYAPGSRWSTWLVEDQRFVHHRPDVLSYETDTLTEDLAVTGTIVAKIFAATTGSDADWIVKLIDVYPPVDKKNLQMSGYQLMVASEVLRGRFRKSFERPQPVESNKVELYTIDLHSLNHVFKKGHKIMVQVQSSWFPLIDRNPQQYVPNIFEAIQSDFIKATHSIYRSPIYPSCLELSIFNL